MIILPTKSIYYNDVNLVAQAGRVKSRKLVRPEPQRIFVSPMDSIVGKSFLRAALQEGLQVTIPRYISIEQAMDMYRNHVPETEKHNLFCAVGLNDFDRVKKLSELGNVNWMLDIAFCDIPGIDGFLNDLVTYPVKRFVIGNIHTLGAYYRVSEIVRVYLGDESDVIYRVGIANGSPCATSDVTGFGRGQITEINEISEGIRHQKDFICSDGGIKHSGYAMKAFGAGANCVMMGGYFARAMEAETHIIGDGTYWGGASFKQIKKAALEKKHSEGKELKIEEELKPLWVLMQEFWGGISSGVSYSGYSSLTEFIGNGVFEIKQNSLPPKR